MATKDASGSGEELSGGPPVPEDPADDAQVVRGFFHAHTKLSTLYSELFRVASAVYSLVDLLSEKGFVSMDEVMQQMEAVQQRLANTEFGQGMAFRVAGDETDKYTLTDLPEVDCDARLALCKAACCALDVVLSAQDLQEGRLKWDYGRPYYLRHRADGYCAHLGEGRGCTAYEHRPRSCRRYTCATDSRIWLDFEARVPNTEKIEALLVQRDRAEMIAADRSRTVPTQAAGADGDTAGGGSS